ncbi:aldo/keto reductase [Tunturiibacter lichenicola]|uniref:aldo/keto reductase n=1 Tax=Tunturiibacter lichenicola TaxID=2051959 RepID=UPI003D9B4B31
MTDPGTKTQLPPATAKAFIGFGCSNLLGEKSRAEGSQLLEAAYASGITHFDVARVYNYGDAEVLVGEFQAGKRDKITLTTKFGLMPAGNVAKMKGPIQVVRSIMRSSSLVRRLVRRNVKKLTQAGKFDVLTAQSSLDTSLKSLKTDYIDFFLLHEAFADDCTPELFEFLNEAVKRGKIRAYGVGSNYAKMERIAKERPEFLPIAQFNSNLLENNLQSFQAIPPAGTSMTITHGALSAAEAIRNRLKADPSLATKWNNLVGFDLTSTPALYMALLQWSLSSNPGGGVIFRASTPERISSNLKFLANGAWTQEQTLAMDRLASQLAP